MSKKFWGGDSPNASSDGSASENDDDWNEVTTKGHQA